MGDAATGISMSCAQRATAPLRPPGALPPAAKGSKQAVCTPIPTPCAVVPETLYVGDGSLPVQAVVKNAGLTTVIRYSEYNEPIAIAAPAS